VGVNEHDVVGATLHGDTESFGDHPLRPIASVVRIPILTKDLASDASAWSG
jgi:hypothetical protein